MPAHPKPPTVLVVDDNPFCRDVLGRLLRRAGYAVREARDGCQALEHLRAGPTPCLVVLDTDMPSGGGPAFRAALLRDPALASLPVVVLTEDHGPGVAAALGAAGYLSKPAPLDEVLRQVRRHCPDPAAAGETP
jgi:putative two-component system response regulator